MNQLVQSLDRLKREEPAKLAALLVALLGLATIGGAWFFQLVIGLPPCPLCLEQRYAYYLAMPLAAFLAYFAAHGAPRKFLMAGFAVLLVATLANAWLGGYHAGVEWKFWPGPTDCSGPIVDFGKAGNLLEQLDKVKVVRCDEVQWRFLGLSFAGYNVLISLSMAVIALFGLVRSARKA